jgi:RNA polymerase sigma-70 factor (ECF subfamily)
MWPNRAKLQFELIVRAHSADLYRFAYWLARDRGVAEDLVQECFTRAWKHFDQLQEGKAVKPWLFTILRNEHARLYAKPRLERNAAPLEAAEEVADTSFCMQTHLDVDRALRQLAVGYREPLLLQLVGGFSCAEIAVMLSLSEANVMTRVSRARRVLRKLLEPEITRQVMTQ